MRFVKQVFWLGFTAFLAFYQINRLFAGNGYFLQRVALFAQLELADVNRRVGSFAGYRNGQCRITDQKSHQVVLARGNVGNREVAFRISEGYAHIATDAGGL